MNKRIALGIFGVLIVVVAITVGATRHGGMGHMNMSASSSQASNSAVATDTIAIKDYDFAPMAVKVKAGTQVTWTNQDSVHHTVTMDDGSSGGPQSGDMAKGDTYSYTFKKAGTYAYHCKIHPEMHGTVVVTE